MGIAEMEDDVNQQVEDALNTIVELTKESGNLKELRNSIHEKSE